MNKEITFVTSYFPPETGAASNRIFSFAEQFQKRGYDVKVISPLPNYPSGKVLNKYRGKLITKEYYEGIKIIRLFIIASKSTNKFKRLFSVLTYAFSVFFYLLSGKTSRKIIVQCSPLIVGFFGIIGAKLRSKKIILNVSDLWPLAGLEMGILTKGKYYSILEKMELYIYKSSDVILGQSLEILKHVNKTLEKNNKKFFLYRNYPQFERPEKERLTINDKIKFVYAGLIGIAQGIDTLCEKVEFPENSEFHIYGDGPLAGKVKAIAETKINIFYHGSLNRKELHKTLIKFDLTIIPLKKRIYGSVPSKIFEYAKLGLPILFFSDGEGADLVDGHKLGISQRKIDYKELENKIRLISKKEIKLPSSSQITSKSNILFDLNRQFEEFETQILDQ
ncbi:MAG: glycosyltransferase [Bacteroidetes bacterium]|nr:glycosyltransferase [Bacteroidota bacterium]